MCLDRWIGTEIENQAAVIWEGEEGEVREVSYKELLEDVENCSAGLRLKGLKKGDAIGIHLPMMIETVIALLAINRIGAIAVPVFSGYGVEAIASRMNAVKAKALITSDGFPRKGKEIDAFDVAAQAIANCPTIKNVFIVNRILKGLPYSFIKAEHKFSYLFFDELLEEGESGIVYSKDIKDKDENEQKLIWRKQIKKLKIYVLQKKPTQTIR